MAAYGMAKNYPPGDREGLIDYLAGAPSPLLSEIFRDSEPASEIHTYRMPGNLRRFWEDLEPRPGRFVVTGDAVGSYNPTYGQGLTTAAFGATYLDEALRANAASLDPVPSEFQRALAAKVEVAFDMSARGDVAYEGAEVINYQPPSEEEQAYVGRLMELSISGDIEVMEALREANSTMRPELLDTEELRRKAEGPPPELPPFDVRDYPTHVYQGRDSVVPG
jgi:2-polyprenyl-6-methoxyphenol hydroxylase-like FAD-dependent oxidoreductase